jgi:hypothetical protein
LSRLQKFENKFEFLNSNKNGNSKIQIAIRYRSIPNSALLIYKEKLSLEILKKIYQPNLRLITDIQKIGLWDLDY